MIERLDVDERDDVVDALVESFWDYPVMRFVLHDSSTEYASHLRALVGHYTDPRFESGGRVLGVRIDGALAAATLINEPQVTVSSEARSTADDELRYVIGETAWDRMVAFEAASATLEPAYPYHFVGMIGVRPEHQGNGLSRLLLDEVSSM